MLLNMKDLIQVARVCKYWKAVAYFPFLWKTSVYAVGNHKVTYEVALVA